METCISNHYEAALSFESLIYVSAVSVMGEKRHTCQKRKWDADVP